MDAPIASPLPLTRPTTNRLFVLGEAGRRRLLKVYVGPTSLAAARRDTEAALLRHWSDAGFPVPRLIDEPLPFLDRPHLVTEFIVGRSLRDFLSDRSRSQEA